MTVLSLFKFDFAKLEETAAFFCIVYAGHADGYVFMPVMLIPIDVCGNFIAHPAPVTTLDRWHLGLALK